MQDYSANFYQIPDGIELNESLSTMFTQVKHFITSALGLRTEKYLQNKKQYFDKFFTIRPEFKAKLANMIKTECPNAFLASRSYIEKLMESDSDVHRIDQGIVYDDEPGKFKMHLKARDTASANPFTNCTCAYILDMPSGKAALLFFTFDNDKIKTCQVTTVDNNSFSHYRFKNLQGISKIDPSEYKK